MFITYFDKKAPLLLLENISFFKTFSRLIASPRLQSTQKDQVLDPSKQIRRVPPHSRCGKFLCPAPAAGPHIFEKSILVTRVTRKQTKLGLVLEKNLEVRDELARVVEVKDVELETRLKLKTCRKEVPACSTHSAPTLIQKIKSMEPSIVVPDANSGQIIERFDSVQR